MHAFLTLAILGLVEGLTEFVPVSSSGHLIVAHQLLGATGPDSLAIDAVLQLAAALAIIVYFFKDLIGLLYTLIYKLTGRPVKREDERLLWALVIGTIPAVVLGLLLEKTMDTVFRNTHLVAYGLVLGSVVMLFSEFASNKKNVHLSMENVSPKKGLVIGFFQTLALVPGMSRSGMTIAGGLYLGLSREAAAKFGFILSIPIILGAGAKKLIDLSHTGTLGALGSPLLLGCAVSFVSAFSVIHWLLLFLRRHPLYAFVLYRVLVAAVILLFIPAF